MTELEEVDAVDKLLDEEKVNWLSIISDHEYRILSKLAVRAEIFDDDLLRKIVKWKLEMAVSRDGERTNQLIEFAKSIQLEGLNPGEEIDAFDDAGNILAQAQENVEKA